MIYRLRYCNKDGVEARVDIQKGSSTPVIEVEGTERPFILSYNNDKGNKSGMFLSSSADIEIYETTDFNIDNLKTSNETELSVTHYIDNVISWQGFIIPDFFSIEVRSNPVITMTASDRLGTLKNVTLSDLPSIMSLRELAILCLNKTGLELPLRTMADFNNGTGINDFFNSKILTQRLSDTKGRSISCYDILSSILTASNSFLVQRAGGWHIINKIQHEAGSGKLYTGATSFINWSDVIFNFSDISIGGRRTIIPVASTVGVFHEFGGGKLHPDNYDFAQGTAGWVASGGYSMNIEDREVKGYSKSGSNWIADFGQTTTKKRLKVQNLLNFPLTNLDSAPYAKATFPLITTNTSSVDISMDMSVMGMPWYRTGVVILAEKGTTRLAFSQSSGKFEPYAPQLAANPGYPDFMINLFLPVQGSAEDKSYYDASTKSIKFSGKLEDSDLTGWNITIRLYGYYSLQLGSRVDFPMFFSFANVSFSNTNEIPKGNIYKTEKDGNFTKAHDIDTSIFADYITYGLNGFFYEYPIDDTSSLYNSANELTSKWTAYNDTEQLPLLQHITRQRSRLFSVAHDLLSAEIEVNNFDPLAIFVACGIRHTVVSAQFDFFKSNLSVELEEVAFEIASARDFIYSYFGDGEEGIKSIGGISGGGGSGGTGGGLTPEQLEILSWWKKDPDDPDTIFTEMNAYSTKELSAYGVGDGGGSGGDGTVVSWGTEANGGVGLTVDGITKTLALKSGLDLKQDKLIAGSGITIVGNTISSTGGGGGSGSVTSVGISVPTGLSVSNSPITSSGVISIGLQTGYSIPTTAKQGQWDTAFGWGDHANKYSHIAHSGYFNSIRTADTRNVEDTPTSRNAGLYVDFKTSAAANLAGSPYVGVLTFRPYGVSTDISGGGIMQIGSNNNSLYYRRFLDADTWRDWVSIWHSGDFTQAEVTNWREVRTWWQNVGQFLKRDVANQALYTDENFYSTKEISAYGIGSGSGSGGGIIETVYGYGNLGQTFNNATLTDTFNAYTINQINTRLVSVESGSALTVNTTGTGNAITSISKSGSVITANKDLTFSLSNHLHTGIYLPLTGGTMANTNLVANLNADLLDGLHASQIQSLNAGYLRVIQSNAGNQTWLPDDISVDTLKLKVYDVYGQADTPSTYGNVLEINGIASHWKPQLWFDGSSHNIRYRNRGYNSTTWLPWKLIAFTDSNVASATKLQTARTIAGVSFDGTANIAIPFANLSSKPTTLGEYGITDATSLSIFNTHNTDNVRHITGAERTKWDGVVGDFATHIANKTNPHLVTTAQIGAVDLTTNQNIGGVKSFTNKVNISAIEALYLESTQTPGLASLEMHTAHYSNNDRYFLKGTVSSPTGKLTKITVAHSGEIITEGNIKASGSVTSPKVIFNSAGWSMEQVGSELQMKHNNLIAARFLSDGSIVGLGEITAYGASTGGEGVSLLRTGGTMTGNLTMSADIIMNSGRSIGKSNLPLKLLGNALTYNASNVLTEANTATQIKMGNGWTIEQTTSALTIKKNGVIKGTFNA